MTTSSPIADLPAGWTDEQEGGHYRVRRREDAALFGYNVGPHAWKRFLHPPLLRLWRAERTGDGLAVTETAEPAERYAFLAVRSCELHAIAIQDRVFLHGPYVDPHYQARREGAFIIAVNCGQAGGTCFCVSMNTGPKAQEGFDLSLTELLGEQHEFLVEVGSERGAALLATVPHRPAEPQHTALAANADRAGRRQHGPPHALGRCARAAAGQSGASALGRRGRTLPDLRQLHDGLPHLLLHLGRG